MRRRKQTLDALALKYGMSRQGVQQIAKRAGFCRGPHRPTITAEEKATFAKLYRGGMRIPDVAASVGRAPEAVRKHLVRAGVHEITRIKRPWPRKHDAIVLRDYPKAQAGKMFVRDIAAKIGRGKNEVIGRARRLGLHRATL